MKTKRNLKRDVFLFLSKNRKWHCLYDLSKTLQVQPSCLYNVIVVLKDFGMVDLQKPFVSGTKVKINKNVHYLNDPFLVLDNPKDDYCNFDIASIVNNKTLAKVINNLLLVNPGLNKNFLKTYNLFDHA